jgi:hypothetical protein
MSSPSPAKPSTNRSKIVMTHDEMVRLLAARAPAWVAAQREAFLPASDAVSEEDRVVLSAYVGPALLQSARLAWTDEIANPDFYAEVEAAGLPRPLDFRLMTAITFVDTIVVSRSQFEGPACWRPLLFHELVHVAQYRALGLERFVSDYVRGWAANGFYYEAIPLERMAYALQTRFERAEGRFSVESEVVRALAEPSARGAAAGP